MEVCKKWYKLVTLKVIQHDSTCYATNMQSQKSWSFKVLPLTFWLKMWETKFKEVLKHQISKQSKAFNVLITWTLYLLLTLMVGILTFLELLWITLWGKSGLKSIWHYPNFNSLLVYWWSTIAHSESPRFCYNSISQASLYQTLEKFTYHILCGIT